MLNITDKKAAAKTIIIYTIIIALFFRGFELFNHIPIIQAIPQIKAVMAILLIIAISFTGISTEFSFLISGILGSFVMGVTLSKYTEYLYKQASSTSIFMIAVAGAVVAALTRSDLLESMKRTNKQYNYEKHTDLEHQVAVFCLFSRLQAFINKVKEKHNVLPSLIFLFQNMLLFVSSVVSAKTFAAMLKIDKDKSPEEENYINAGILCMCVSGCLLMFFFMKSPWWLFFTSLAKDVTIKFPLAALIYGIFSFIHGYSLVSKGESKEVANVKKEQDLHSLAGRHFVIYTGLIVVFLAFATPTALQYINAADNNSKVYEYNLQEITDKVSQGVLTASEGSKEIYSYVGSNRIHSSSDYINLGISLVLLVILVAMIAATVITKHLMQQPKIVPDKSSTMSELKELILGDKGIKSVISSIVLIVTILAFRDMINECVGSAPGGAAQINSPGGINFMSTDGMIALLGCLTTLVVVVIIGWILGSNFGAFSIGWIIFGILAGRIPGLNDTHLRRWVLESIIIVSTFCNQTSPQSSNASALVSKQNGNLRSVQEKAWKAESLFGYSAMTVQTAAAGVCLVLSGIFTAVGIQ